MSDTGFSTRRGFLNRGLTLVGGAASVPLFLERTAFALAGGDPRDAGSTNGEERAAGRSTARADRDLPVLVVVQLAGGNDGLNTVVPVRDDAYYRARPRLAIAREKSLRLTDSAGLHPAAVGLKSLYDDGRLAIVQGVGYPNPNRSHFTSTDIWMSADPTERTHTGWVGRYFDCACRGDDPPDPKLGVALVSEAPLALTGERYHPVAFSTPDQLTWRAGPRQKGAERAFAALNRPTDDGHDVDGRAASDPRVGRNGTLEYLQRTAMDARLSAEKIQDACGASGSNRRRRPLENLRQNRGDLTQQLRMVARMIAAGLPTRVYYVSLGGFDTHANQVATHERLLRTLGEALAAFTDDLKKSGDDRRVLTMTFSEFGRRVAENGSGGTDHGAAAPMFLIGPAVKPGLHGAQPSLTSLERGDLKWAVDFRQVYAEVLGRWLKADVRRVLGGEFAPLRLLA